jgi:hypothetical protein
MTWLLAHPLSPSPFSKIHSQHTGRPRKRDNLLKGEVGEEPNHAPAKNQKSWSSTKHSMLSDELTV